MSSALWISGGCFPDFKVAWVYNVGFYKGSFKGYYKGFGGGVDVGT